MPKRTRAYHEFLLEQLIDPVFASEYLNEARQDSQKIFLKAMRNVAEARRISVVAAEAGVNRESLYRTLSEEGNPRLETYESVLSALGIDYEFKPKEPQIAAPVPTGPKTQITSAAAFEITGTTPAKSTLTGSFWGGMTTTTFSGNGILISSTNAPQVGYGEPLHLPIDFIAYATKTQNQPAIDYATGD